MRIRRWLAVASATAALAAAPVGGTAAAARSVAAPAGEPGQAAACAAMHETPAMRQMMRDQLPSTARAQMERMHIRMQGTMGQMGQADMGMGQMP